MSPRDRRLTFSLAMVWSFLLPVQLPLLEGGGRPLRLALSDLVLLLVLALVGRHLTLRRGTWSIWHFLLPILIGLNALGPGLVSRYTLFNKLIGMIVLLVGYLFVTSFTTTWADARAWMRAYVLGVTTVTAITLPGFLIGYRLPFVTCHTETCDRLTGLYHDANLFGAAVVLALTMIVVLVGTDHVLLPAPFNLVVMVVLGAGLFFSSSRSSWLGMGMVLLLLALTRPARASLMIIVGVPIAAAFLLFGTGGQDDEFINRASRTHSIESRFDIIYHALDRFMDAPLFGIGVGRFPLEHGNIIHNTTLWFATEMGTIGLLVFGGFIAFVTLRLVTGYRTAVGDDKDVFLALGLCHGAMFTFSMGVEALYQRHWWLVMALIAVGNLLPTSQEPPTDGFTETPDVEEPASQSMGRFSQ